MPADAWPCCEQYLLVGYCHLAENNMIVAEIDTPTSSVNRRPNSTIQLLLLLVRSQKLPVCLWHECAVHVQKKPG